MGSFSIWHWLIVLVIVLFGGFIIRTAFGEEYAAAYAPLVILCIGQIVNASMGSVGSLLQPARVTAQVRARSKRDRRLVGSMYGFYLKAVQASYLALVCHADF